MASRTYTGVSKRSAKSHWGSEGAFGVQEKDRKQQLRVSVDMELDDRGNPMPPAVEGAQITAQLARGLDVSKRSGVAPYRTVFVDANRQGLLWMAYQCLALAHAVSKAENDRAHAHIVDPLPGAAGDSLGVTVYLVGSTKMG